MIMENLKYIVIVVSVIGLVFSAYVTYKRNFDKNDMIITFLWLTIVIKDLTILLN